MEQMVNVNKSKIKKHKQSVILLLLVIGTLIANFSFNFVNFSAECSLNDRISKNKDKIGDFKDISPQISAYSNNITGIGESDLDITLHQSFLDTSETVFDNLSDSHILTEPFPKDGNFEGTYANISIEGIGAPNKTLNVETIVQNQHSIGAAFWYYTSFEVLDTCYLENVSLNLQSASGGTTWTIDVYSAKLETYLKPYSSLTESTGLGTVFDSSASPVWLSLYHKHQLLNISKTEQNKFFIQVYASGPGSDWSYESINPGDTISWADDPSQPENFDFTLKVGVSPMDYDPAPKEIGLKINGTDVINSTVGSENSGTWVPSTTINSNFNDVDFEITADWYDVNCSVSRVQINYTDNMALTSTSRFNASLELQNIIWNVSMNQHLNYFDSQINDYNVINFTIPDNWLMSTVKVWNGTNEFTSFDTIDLTNQYTRIRVPYAGNGTFWHLTANSTNLLRDSIKMDVNGLEITEASESYDVRFNTTFIEPIPEDSSDGDGINISLTIYNPDKSHNNTYDKDTYSAGDDFRVYTWDIPSNPTLGDYPIQAFWQNGTAVGYINATLTIIIEQSTGLDESLTSFSVIKGDNASYYCNYTSGGSKIKFANITNLNSPPGLDFVYARDPTDDEYSLNITTENAETFDTPIAYNFEIWRIGYALMTIYLSITVFKRGTNVVNLTYPSSISNTPTTLTIRFYFNDTYYNQPISGLVQSNITIKITSPSPSTLENDNWTFIANNPGNGYYIANIKQEFLEKLASDTKYSFQITVTWSNDYVPDTENFQVTKGTVSNGGDDDGGGGGGGDGGNGGGGGGGIPVEIVVFTLILIGLAAGAIAGSLGIYKGVIVPKRIEKVRNLSEVTTIFDDASNIEHVFVVHKETGRCIFFKSYGSEEIDPEVIKKILAKREK